MALKAGYVGVKKAILSKLSLLDGAKIIKSVGAGLNYNSGTGALSCKSATASQAGIAKSTDYIGSEVTLSNIIATRDAETGAITALTVPVTSDITSENTAPVTSGSVFTALAGKLSVSEIGTVADLDDYKDTGLYVVTNTSTTNRPGNTGNMFTLLVVKFSDIFVQQIAIEVTGTKETIYTRRYGGATPTFSSWYKIDGTAV